MTFSGLQHLCHGDGLGKSGMFQLEKRHLWGDFTAPSHVHRGSKRTGEGLGTGVGVAERAEGILTDRGQD